MPIHQHLLLLQLHLVSLITFSVQTSFPNQSHFFTLMKQSFTGTSMSKWDLPTSTPYCNYPGVLCGDSGEVRTLDLTGWSLSGRLPDSTCTHLPNLQVLRLSGNHISGGFPQGITNCSSLNELFLSSSNITGDVADLSNLSALKELDLSYNHLSGKFPTFFINLTNLEAINFNENDRFQPWKMPADVEKLGKLKRMILTSCSMYGSIPPEIGNMTSLVDLELSGNFLTGTIPIEIAKLTNLAQLELYYNQLSGHLPDELGNMSMLSDIDVSVNGLTGVIPESLCRLPNLRVIHLYNNSLTGEIPHVLGNSTTLTGLSLYENSLAGPLPKNLGKFSKLQLLDVSENRLSGELPDEICRGRTLVYFLVLENRFSGWLPESYGRCISLVRFRVSNNELSGTIPDGVVALPRASIIDLAHNNFDGPMPKSIENAKNLSEFFAQNNRISGSIPAEISRASNLMKVDLSYNMLSGPIPSEMGEAKKLNILLLQGNELNSTIPHSLAALKSLNLLNLSNNHLTGNIPEALCELLPNSLDFSNNHLSGPIPLPLIKEGLTDSVAGNPQLCLPNGANSIAQSLPLCDKTKNPKRFNHIWLIGLSGTVAAVGLLLLLKRCFNIPLQVNGKDGSSPWSSTFTYDVQSFHKVTFDQSEIVAGMNDKNLVGHGGSGTVYKIELSDGGIVAVKNLWTRKTKESPHDQFFHDRELEAEVQTLGNIRHKNIVKLYCCFTSPQSNLLVYEYMPNGNLWDVLHRGKCALDWPARHKIALGVAQGLAYLHHDLVPPIVHRDIKSTNILLNADYLPKVADFGVAKVLQARGMDCSSTVIAGTYGYLAPEYAYTAKATTKCDVYSFGVVLMELITGKKPIDSEFGENKNIIFWVMQKLATKEAALEILDKKLEGSFKEDMIQALRLAIRCTAASPATRPAMAEVVKLLIEADPCRFDPSKLVKSSKDSSPITIHPCYDKREQCWQREP